MNLRLANLVNLGQAVSAALLALRRAPGQAVVNPISPSQDGAVDDTTKYPLLPHVTVFTVALG
jgi:hypothetical protein